MWRKHKCDDGSNLEHYQTQPQEFKMLKALHTHLEKSGYMVHLPKLGLLVEGRHRHVRINMNSQHLTFDPPFVYNSSSISF